MNYIQRKSDGKFLVDVRSDGRVVLNVWRDKAIEYPDEKLSLAQHTVASLGADYEIVTKPAAKVRQQKGKK